VNVVLAACLWHDAGKVDEYVLMNYDFLSDDRRRLPFAGNTYWEKAPGVIDGQHPHIVFSRDAFYSAANTAGVSQGIQTQIAHCIASHHGRHEWGALEEPRTPEACLVHQADMLSARFGSFEAQQKS
jgi:3'-5' exoribonuclease